MSAIERRIDPGSWRATVLPLPRGYYDSVSVGLFEWNPAGNCFTSSNRAVPHLWVGGKPEKISAGGKEPCEFASARGHQIVGKIMRSRRSEGAVLWHRDKDDKPEVVSLHPAIATNSAALGCWNGHQCGSVSIDGKNRAVVWSGSAESMKILKGLEGAAVRALAGSSDSGIVGIGGGFPGRALYWRDAEIEPVELNPRGIFYSSARAIDGGQQAGVMATEPMFHAGNRIPVVWHGSADSVVKLLPEGFESGEAHDCAAGMQAGAVRRGDASTGFERAALWLGSAASFIDLHPFVGGKWTDSAAKSIHVVGERVIVLGEVKMMSPDRRGSAGTQMVMWLGKLS